jgi:hypothetical protein
MIEYSKRSNEVMTLPGAEIPPEGSAPRPFLLIDGLVWLP